MKITIDGTPKEIADLERALKDGNNIENVITRYYINEDELARAAFKTRNGQVK